MRLFPSRKAKDIPETKGTDVMPEFVWDQLENALALGSGPLNLEGAVGLPALLAVIRLVSHATALVPLEVFRVDDNEVRTKARDVWQRRLLVKRPGAPPATPFNVKADIAASFLGRGNAYVRKLKPSVALANRPRVLELMPVSAAYVTPKRSATGAVIFEDSSTGAHKPIERSTAEMIQIRSFSISRDGLQGLAPITAARLMISAGIKRHQFEERHMANGIFPGLGVKFPESVKRQDAERWLELVESSHQGSYRAGKTLAVGGGADLVPIPISLEDAQFAESIRLTIEQACAIYQVPLAVMNAAVRRPVTDDDWRALHTYACGPVLQAMIEAFEADDDLFGPQDQDLEVRQASEALLELDPLKKAQVQKERVQAGLRLVDEIRNEDGLGPLPPVPDDPHQEPGKVPQITPVGGAPNPAADAPPAPQDNPDD